MSQQATKSNQSLSTKEKWEAIRNILLDYVKDPEILTTPSDYNINLMYTAIDKSFVFNTYKKESLKLLVNIVKNNLSYEPFYKILAASCTSFRSFFLLARIGYYYKNETLSKICDHVLKNSLVDWKIDLDKCISSHFPEYKYTSGKLIHDADVIVGNEDNVFNVIPFTEQCLDVKDMESWISTFAIFKTCELNDYLNNFDREGAAPFRKNIVHCANMLYKYIKLDVRQQMYIFSCLEPEFRKLVDVSSEDIDPHIEMVLALVTYYSLRYQEETYTIKRLRDMGIFNVNPEKSVLPQLIDYVDMYELSLFFTELAIDNTKNAELFFYSFFHADNNGNDGFSSQETLRKILKFAKIPLELIHIRFGEVTSVDIKRKYLEEKYYTCVAERLKTMVTFPVKCHIQLNWKEDGDEEDLLSQDSISTVLEQWSDHMNGIHNFYDLKSYLNEMLSKDEVDNIMKYIALAVKKDLKASFQMHHIKGYKVWNAVKPLIVNM